MGQLSQRPLRLSPKVTVPLGILMIIFARFAFIGFPADADDAERPIFTTTRLAEVCCLAFRRPSRQSGTLNTMSKGLSYVGDPVLLIQNQKYRLEIISLIGVIKQHPLGFTAASTLFPQSSGASPCLSNTLPASASAIPQFIGEQATLYLPDLLCLV